MPVPKFRTDLTSDSLVAGSGWEPFLDSPTTGDGDPAHAMHQVPLARRVAPGRVPSQGYKGERKAAQARRQRP